jgi:hypothetical protein
MTDANKRIGNISDLVVRDRVAEFTANLSHSFEEPGTFFFRFGKRDC